MKRKIINPLHDFLNKHTRKTNDTMTNTRIGNKKTIAGGCYSIPDELYDDFLKIFLKKRK